MEDDEIVYKTLSDHKFPKINSGLLNSPGYTNNDILENKLLQSEDATYDYILDLKERDLTKTSLQKRKNNCDKHKLELNYINKYLDEKPFPGSSLWLQEIDILLSKLK